MRSTMAALVVMGLAACAPGGRAQTPPAIGTPVAPARDTASAGRRDTTVYGTLNTGDIALRLRSSELEIRFVPLTDRITRLLARDAAQSLRGLVASQRDAIDALARENGLSDPGLALVTFFGQKDGARFDPGLVTLVAQGRFLRPVGVVPLTSRFSSQQLSVREQVSGIFLYEQAIPVDESFTVTYDTLTSDDWQRKLQLLDRERSRQGSGIPR